MPPQSRGQTDRSQSEQLTWIQALTSQQRVTRQLREARTDAGLTHVTASSPGSPDPAPLAIADQFSPLPLRRAAPAPIAGDPSREPSRCAHFPIYSCSAADTNPLSHGAPFSHAVTVAVAVGANARLRPCHWLAAVGVGLRLHHDHDQGQCR